MIEPAHFRSVRLGGYTFDSRSRELRRGGRRIRLGEKPSEVLSALLEQPGEPVTRAELRRRLWPDGTVVDFDNNLNSAVATLRAIFRDSAQSPRYIETLPRVGYRLLARPEPEPPKEREPARRSVRLGARALQVALPLLLILIAFAASSRIAVDAGAAASPSAPAGGPAREAWRQGLYLQERAGARDLGEALDRFTRVVALEPNFAPAHAARAECLVMMSFHGQMGVREGLSQARAAARAALDLDPEIAAAHRILAVASLHLDWDLDAAGVELERALLLDPHDPRTQLTAATFLTAAGRHGAAVAAARRAVELDPASFLVRADLGYFLLADGRFEEAATASREALELEPGFTPALGFLLLASERLGRLEEAAATARRLLVKGGASAGDLERFDLLAPDAALHHYRRWDMARVEESGSASFLGRALRHAAVDADAALDDLEQALARREPMLIYVGGFRELDGLREQPRYEALVRDVRGGESGEDVVRRMISRLEIHS